MSTFFNSGVLLKGQGKYFIVCQSSIARIFLVRNITSGNEKRRKTEGKKKKGQSQKKKK